MPAFLRCSVTFEFDRPEMGLVKSYVQAIADDRVPHWSYNIYTDLLRFDYNDIKRVWKRTGSHFTDEAEYIDFRWPD